MNIKLETRTLRITVPFFLLTCVRLERKMIKVFRTIIILLVKLIF